MNISILDWTIVVVYLVGVVGLGCWAGINAKKKGQQHGESVAGDYFMAAHTLKWPVIGLALFATNISCVHLVTSPSPATTPACSTATSSGWPPSPSSCSVSSSPRSI